MEKTSMPNPIKCLGYISATARVVPDLIKALVILSDTTVRRSAVDWEELKPYRKSEKRPHFFRWSTILLFTSFSKPHPFLTMPTVNLCEFVTTCKKSFHWLIFWIYGWLKNPAIWLAENILAHMQELKFSQIWNGCRNAANNINFHYRINSVRINDKFFSINSKNPVFGTFLVCFPNFGGKKIFSGKSGCHAQLHMEF